MENLLKHQENQTPSFLPSPRTYSTTTTSSANSSTNNGFYQLPPPTPPPVSPIPITRSDPNNPYPTTFVQADSSSFKQVVQMLTGSSDNNNNNKNNINPTTKPDPTRNTIPPVRTIPKIQKSSSKLYERRNSLKNFKISPIGPGPTRPGTPEILSPSILDFPNLVLSPVTPLIPDPFNRAGLFMKSNLVNVEAEEKAIAEKGFFLHPSPVSTPTDTKPRLLPLFPETSPRVVAGSCDSGI